MKNTFYTSSIRAIGGIATVSDAVVHFRNCTFADNVSYGLGAGIVLHNSQGKVITGGFYNNTATTGAAGVLVFNSRPDTIAEMLIDNAYFLQNSLSHSSATGSALLVLSTNNGFAGAGLVRSNIILNKCTGESASSKDCSALAVISQQGPGSKANLGIGSCQVVHSYLGLTVSGRGGETNSKVYLYNTPQVTSAPRTESTFSLIDSLSNSLNYGYCESRENTKYLCNYCGDVLSSDSYCKIFFRTCKRDGTKASEIQYSDYDTMKCFEGFIPKGSLCERVG